jgi:hypothetical protein
MYEFSLIETITNKLELEEDIEKISLIDFINFCFKYNELISILRTYENPSREEKYIIDVFACKRVSRQRYLLSQNYFNNLLLDIYFIIGNSFSIDTFQFDELYKHKKIINRIPNILINIYDKLMKTKDLYKYYNIDIIKRWENSIIQKPVLFEDYDKKSKLSKEEKIEKWIKYVKIFKIYNDNCLIFKNYLTKVNKFYSQYKIDIVGCYNVCKKLYLNCLETHLGIKLDIDRLERWAIKELERLSNEIKKYVKIINPSIKDTNHLDMLNQINNSQLYKSKDEYIKHHQEIIKKYRELYINKLEFKLYSEPNLVIFDSKDLGGGYYFEDNFYLNAYNWKKSHRYTTESLVLHETLPGHHLQVHTTQKVEFDNRLLYYYFNSIINGFVEGWGLFSEKLGINQTTWDKIGRAEYEILRTLRVIVDIRIHYRGKTPQEIFKFMKQYLSTNDNTIMNEIYRYVCNPGQAISYKIGSEVFKKILDKNGIKTYLEPNAIKIYKKIIEDGHKPIKFLIEEYNINKDELF